MHIQPSPPAQLARSARYVSLQPARRARQPSPPGPLGKLVFKNARRAKISEKRNSSHQNRPIVEFIEKSCIQPNPFGPLGMLLFKMLGGRKFSPPGPRGMLVFEMRSSQRGINTSAHGGDWLRWHLHRCSPPPFSGCVRVVSSFFFLLE